MITPRHHALSLTAVLLALVLGVIAGSGLLSRPLLSGMQSDKQELRAQVDALRDQQGVLNERLQHANTFDAQMAPRTVRDALHGKSAVIFRTPDAADGDVEAVTRIIGQAGGVVAGTVGLTPQFVEGNAEEKLRVVLESGIVPAGGQLNANLIDQGAQAGDLLGLAVLINRNPTIAPADDTQRETVLAALRDTGFVSYQHVGAANAAVVVTGGGLAEDAGSSGVSVAQFASALAPHGSATVLAGRDGCASGTAAVAVARADSSMAGAISTVDDIDVESGRITTVLAVSTLIEGGHPGQYGIGHGAGSVTLAQ